MSEKISVIMPAYNAEKFIGKSIDSVLNQTYQNWELIIVDDCSKDSTNEIIAEYANRDDRIKQIVLKENKGVANARNTAINESSGRYIAYLDSDDVWHSSKLLTQLTEMRNENAYFSCSSYQLIDENDSFLSKGVYVKGKISHDRLLKGSRVGCLTVMIDQTIVSKEDLMMKKIGHEDYECWLRLTKKYGEIHCVEEILADYRVFKDSLSGNKSRAIKWQYNIYKDIMHLSLLKSFFLMFFYAFNALTKNKNIR